MERDKPFETAVCRHRPAGGPGRPEGGPGPRRISAWTHVAHARAAGAWEMDAEQRTTQSRGVRLNVELHVHRQEGLREPGGGPPPTGCALTGFRGHTGLRPAPQTGAETQTAAPGSGGGGGAPPTPE